MTTALNKLGYKTYHMTVTASAHASERHVLHWAEGLRIKVNKIGKPYGRAEFDKLLKFFS